jgi:hypothetical protein
MNPEQIEGALEPAARLSPNTKMFADVAEADYLSDRRSREKFSGDGRRRFARYIEEKTQGSRTPTLMLVEEGDTAESLMGVANETLGDRMTPQQIEALKAELGGAKAGDVLNLSGYMSTAAAASWEANGNFMSGFVGHLDAETDKTSFLESPSAHITYAWASGFEGLGRTFETAVDSSSPAHIKRRARMDASIEVGVTAMTGGMGRLKPRLTTRAPSSKRNWQFGNLPNGVLGSTDKFGNITIQNGLSGRPLLETVRHEKVHAFLSPKQGTLFAEARANFGMFGYNNSSLLRYIEEAAAETVGTGSLYQGLKFPVTHGYVTHGNVLLEAGAYSGGIYLGGQALSDSLGQ